MGAQGFNPYMNFNPYANQYSNYGNNNQQGFDVYDPSKRQQPFNYQIGGYGIYSPFMNFCNPYGQNQFNVALQEYLYNDDEFSMDAIKMLEQIVLSDDDREKINHNNQNFIIGKDYYGRPIYNNGYAASQQRQNELQEARLRTQKYFTKLSRIAHTYSGEEIDEEATMKRFDPMGQYEQATPKMFNYYTATDEERKNYEEDMLVYQVNMLDSRFEEMEKNRQMYEQQKRYAFMQIKASHDRMIGVEPGEHYDLKTYMDNAYKIGISLEHKKAKSQERNGTNKYSRFDFRNNLQQTTNCPVPMTSKDDDYVSVEEMLKGIYDRNKRIDSVLRGNGNQFGGNRVVPTNPSFSSEQEAHRYFLEAVQNKKNIDDVKRSVI